MDAQNLSKWIKMKAEHKNEDDADKNKIVLNEIQSFFANCDTSVDVKRSDCSTPQDALKMGSFIFFKPLLLAADSLVEQNKFSSHEILNFFDKPTLIKFLVISWFKNGLRYDVQDIHEWPVRNEFLIRPPGVGQLDEPVYTLRFVKHDINDGLQPYVMMFHMGNYASRAVPYPVEDVFVQFSDDAKKFSITSVVRLSLDEFFVDMLHRFFVSLIEVVERGDEPFNGLRVAPPLPPGY